MASAWEKMFEDKNEQRNLPELFELGIPILGICYGAQLTSYLLRGKVATAPVSEYGKTEVEICQSSVLDSFEKTIYWMSHTDYIETEPEGVTVTAHTPVCSVAVIFGPQGAYDLNFIRVFEEEAKKIGAVDFLVQGTIYPDIIESGLGESAVIKSHHNVDGLPDCVEFKEIIEPLRLLFKDEVRKAGLELGLPEHLAYHQPFPGLGLGIRIIGEVTEEKVRIVQDVDYIYRAEIEKAGLNKNLGQYFAAITNMRSVGCMGDERTYDYAIALRAVTTSDFMTAETAVLPWELLGKVSNRIVNEVKGVNRVLYDCTGKPSATIVLDLIEYEKSQPDVVKAILEAVKRICTDERFEKTRWISNYHWLLLLIYTFEGIEDTMIKDAFIQREEYMWESSMALLAIYSGSLQELNLKKKNDKTLEVATQIDCRDELLELAKESEIISKQLDNIIQIFVQEKCNIRAEYVEKLIRLGENGALVAGVLCYCYGMPIHVESEMGARQTYFLRSKIDSKIFLKLVQFTKMIFNKQLEDVSKLEEYKVYLEKSESHLDEVYLNKCFYISEYLYYVEDKITEERILKYLDVAMNEMHYSKYTTLAWDMLAEYINSNEEIEQDKLRETLEIGLHRIIGSCEENRSFLYNEAYGQIAIACMFWKINNKYTDLAQPVFERGIVQLIRAKYEKNIWDEEKTHIDFEKLNMYLNMVPNILCVLLSNV